MEIIDQLKASSLTFKELQYLAGFNQTKRCRWVVYDELRNYKNLEHLMALGAAVILLEIERRDAPKVGHFVLILDHGSHYEHFDSYGISHDKELAIISEHHLTNFFKNSKKKIIENTTKLQMFREDVNTCGRWCVARLLLRKIELQPFVKIFDHLRPQTPDEMVSVMTLLLQYDK